jgi:hypothetical protein
LRPAVTAPTPVKKKREDIEAELETVQTVNTFLTSKLKENESIITTYQQDIKILKDYFLVEKGVASKREAQLRRCQQDLSELREQTLKRENEQKEQLT